MPPHAEDQPFTIDVQDSAPQVQMTRRRRGRSVLETTLVFRTAEGSGTRVRTENASKTRISITGPRPGDEDEDEEGAFRPSFEATAHARPYYNCRTAITITHRDVNLAMSRRRYGYEPVHFVQVAPIPESEVPVPPPVPEEIEVGVSCEEDLTDGFVSEDSTRVEDYADDEAASEEEDIGDILASLPPRPGCPSPTTAIFDHGFYAPDLGMPELSDPEIPDANAVEGKRPVPQDDTRSDELSFERELQSPESLPAEFVQAVAVAAVQAQPPLPPMTFASPSTDSLDNNTVEDRVSIAASSRSNASGHRFISLSKNVRLLLRRPHGFKAASASVPSLPTSILATQKNGGSSIKSVKLLLSSYATKAKGLSKGSKRSREDEDNVDNVEVKNKEDRPIKGRSTRRKLAQ